MAPEEVVVVPYRQGIARQEVVIVGGVTGTPAGLNTYGVMTGVYIPAGGTVPEGTPAYALVIEVS